MSETDKKAESLLSKIREKKDAIPKAKASRWQTNCNFYFSEEEPKRLYNIHVVGNEDLVKILAFLLEKHERFEQAKKTVSRFKSIAQLEFKWLGYSFDDWLNDIVSRIEANENAKTKRAIEESEKKVMALFSGEAKTKMQLEEIDKEISDMLS